VTEPEIIEIRDTEIDVQAIMAEIREKIAQKKREGIFSPEVERGLYLPLPSLPSTIGEENILLALSQKVRLDIDLPIRSHRRPPLGPMIVAGKKLLRSILRWYFEQIALQVESFQRGVVEALKIVVEGLKIEKVRLDSLEKKVEVLRSEFDLTLSRIEQMEDKVSSLAEKIHTPLTEGAIDYLEFNRRYGGEVGLLRRRYERFLVYFEGCRDVVDLGCGQGAFLELLRTHGIPALGVDRVEKMVRQCRDQNLNVVQAEILSYLRVQRTGSLGGIFAAHLVEHLTPSELVTFIKLCHHTLRPGAPLVLISPNGCSVFVLTQAFYRDPTHVKPVHPETLAFLVESQGFNGVTIEYYEEVPRDLRLTETNEGEESLRSALNHHIGELNRFLFGFQDYAVVAKK